MKTTQPSVSRAGPAPADGDDVAVLPRWRQARQPVHPLDVEHADHANVDNDPATFDLLQESGMGVALVQPATAAAADAAPRPPVRLTPLQQLYVGKMNDGLS